MFTEYFATKNISKAILRQPKYRQCKRCGYQILNQLPGCPNCNGLSDEEADKLLESLEIEQNGLPNLGKWFIIVSVTSCIAVAALYWFL